MMLANTTPYMKERAASFSYIIHEGEDVITFYFEPVFMIKKIKYLVTVYDAIRTLAVFNMEKTPFGWKIINAPKISDEYMQMESRLAKLIERNGL